MLKKYLLVSICVACMGCHKTFSAVINDDCLSSRISFSEKKNTIIIKLEKLVKSDTVLVCRDFFQYLNRCDSTEVVQIENTLSYDSSLEIPIPLIMVRRKKTIVWSGGSTGELTKGRTVCFRLAYFNSTRNFRRAWRGGENLAPYYATTADYYLDQSIVKILAQCYSFDGETFLLRSDNCALSLHK